MKRIITAIVMIAVFIPVLLFSDTLLFPIVISIMGAVAAFEILYIRKLHQKIYLLIPSVLLAVACPLVSGTDWFKVFTSRSYNFLIIAFPVYLMYMLFVGVACNRKVSFNDILYTIVSVSYVSFAMFTIPFIRAGSPYNYLLLIICPCVADIFALYGGSKFGKKKLCPAVSPKKTLAGFMFGLLGGAVGAALFNIAIMLLIDSQFNILKVIAGVGIAFAGQYGDLIASMMKRSSNAKDFGNIFPGHGGIMDRFDSIFSSFICAFLCLMIAKVVFALV